MRSFFFQGSLSWLKKLLQWAIALAAYVFLAYTLFTFDYYQDLKNTFLHASFSSILSLFIALFLLPINLLLESWKWQSLLRTIVPLSLSSAFRQVCAGMAGGFLTPYRAGDYPSRLLLLPSRASYAPALLMGVVGSMVLTWVIIFMGLLSFLCFFAPLSTFFSSYLSAKYLFFCALLLCFLALLVLALPYLAKRYSLRYPDCALSLFQSFLRYLCFSLQLLCILLFCGVPFDFSSACMLIPLYYLLVTITPNMPLADVGIRGAWAVALFGAFYPQCEAHILLSTSLLWLINTVLPSFLGAYFIKKPQ